MQLKSLYFLLGLLCLGLQVANASVCSTSSPVGTLCSISAYDIKPTQFAVGKSEIACKVHYLESLSSSQLASFLAKSSNYLPCVIGPEKMGVYQTDHHHLARALYDSSFKKSEKILTCNVTNNWASLDKKHDFWTAMLANNKVWLYDEKGMPNMSPYHIPDNVGDLQNDFYRSFAFFLKHKGGYGHTDSDFSDFQWTNFLRANLPPPQVGKQAYPTNATHWTFCAVCPYAAGCIPDEINAINSQMPAALRLAASPAARDLPGFNQGTVSAPNCG